MSLWWLPLLLKRASAGLHLLRAVQLPLHAVMKLLADKTLNCLLLQTKWITKGIGGETENEGSCLKAACLRPCFFICSQDHLPQYLLVKRMFCPFESFQRCCEEKALSLMKENSEITEALISPMDEILPFRDQFSCGAAACHTEHHMVWRHATFSHEHRGKTSN